MSEPEPLSGVNPFQSPESVSESLDHGADEVVWDDGDLPAIRKVRLGLLLVYAGIVGVLLIALSSIPLSMIFGVQVGIVVLAFVAICSLMIIVGPFFCLPVPAHTGASGFAIGAVVCEVLALLMAVVLIVADSRLMVVPIALSWLSQLVGLASTTFFVLFLRKLSQHMQRHDLVRRANFVLIAAAVVIIAGFATAFYTIGAARPGQPNTFSTPLFVLAILGILGIVAFVMYANLVNYVRKALPA